MMGASNDFYNFISESFLTFKKEDGISLERAWDMYNTYCEKARVSYPMSRRVFKEELKNYFREYKDRYLSEDGSRPRHYYSGFKTEKFEEQDLTKKDIPIKETHFIEFKEQPSVFDEECADYIAQYANEEEYPIYKWSNVKTHLKDIDTHRLHYVRVPLNHIVIDFDIPDENGEKSYERNLEEASKWPATYAELSKSGKGIHLHYIYNGDPSKLSRIYDEHIEVKVFSGKSSLRRRLSKCNNRPIATISSGLPLKGETKVVSEDILMNDRGLRTFIKRNLNKEYHANTKPSIDFIFDQLERQYASGKPYDVSDMKPDVTAFAMASTNQSDYCLKLVQKMHFKSKDPIEDILSDSDVVTIFDCEVFPNVNFENMKVYGEGKPMRRYINPTPDDIEAMFNTRLIGFNNRRYDNHIMEGIHQGDTAPETYDRSASITSGKKNGFIGIAYNRSFMDLYDVAAKKQSLKKWEIELTKEWNQQHPDIPAPWTHMELGLPWDQPVPEELWPKVSQYCDNDVLATEALYNYLLKNGDIQARLILADLSGLTPNDTTNSHTTKIIFGSEKNPQRCFNYRFLGDCSDVKTKWDDISWFDSQGRPVFNGYTFEYGKSLYLGEEVGEGGWVFAKPGMYRRVITYDIASMHPSSIIAENLFGEFTERFEDILEARIAIKHKDFNKAKTMLGGALAKHLGDESSAKGLSQALKIAINSVYGLTSAKFDNPFRDPRNVDNIVAKRGALFMINLKTEVERRGYNVIHVKTDSIKIENPDDDIQKFVYEYGKMYGYNFEIEHVFEKFCIVNDAVYVGKLADDDPEDPGKWTATGKQFQVPYIFKTLFSHEPLDFYDMTETMSVTTALYLDMNENLKDGEHDYRFIGKVGLFSPMQDGVNAGYLMRQSTDKNGNIKYDAATGTKGYKWMESEMVRLLKLEDKIDRSYYDRQVDQAILDISKYGDFEWFISDDKEEPKNDAETDMLLASVFPW
jgi:hypothetical protein